VYEDDAQGEIGELTEAVTKRSVGPVDAADRAAAQKAEILRALKQSIR
jgi:hypothetical protein